MGNVVKALGEKKGPLFS